jgi:hypothetical protein
MKERGLSASFNFLQNPASAGFFLSALEIASKGHPMHRSHDINYHICDIKHISLLSSLQCLFRICWRS